MFSQRDDNRVVVLMGVNNVTGDPQEVLVDADGRVLVSAVLAVDLGDLDNVVLTNPQDGDVLTYDSGTGNWINEAGGGGGTPGGSNTQLQYNNASAFGGITGATTDGTNVTFGNTALRINDSNASHTWTITPTDDLGANRTLSLTFGDTNRVLTAYGDLFLAAGFTTLGSFPITLTATNTTSVTLPLSGTLATLAGSETLTNKTLTTPIISTISNTGTVTLPTATDTLVARATTDTLTNKTINGANNTLTVLAATQLSGQAPVANGGTGAATFTDGGVLIGNGTGAVQATTAGTAGQVLTSNGAGVDPTFQDAAAGGGVPRRNLNINLVSGYGEHGGTDSPSNDTSINGVICTVNASNDTSYVKINTGGVANWDVFDRNLEINLTTQYSAGSAAGNGYAYFGVMANDQRPLRTAATNNRVFIIATTAGGTTTWYAANCNGSNTNTSLAGITSTDPNQWRIIQDGTTDIKFYCNYTLVATHTTNLPAGSLSTADVLTIGSWNAVGDATTRSCKFGFVEALVDSPT